MSIRNMTSNKITYLLIFFISSNQMIKPNEHEKDHTLTLGPIISVGAGVQYSGAGTNFELFFPVHKIFSFSTLVGVGYMHYQIGYTLGLGFSLMTRSSIKPVIRVNYTRFLTSFDGFIPYGFVGLVGVQYLSQNGLMLFVEYGIHFSNPSIANYTFDNNFERTGSIGVGYKFW